MKRSDLKTGMVLVDGEGSKMVVMLGTANGDILVGSTWCPLDRYTQDLTHYSYTNGKYDVVKVLDPCSNMDYTHAAQNKDFSNNTIWERPKKPKTVSFGGQDYTKEEFEKLQTSVNTLMEEF